MRRLHVHLSVRDLESSVRFYSALLGGAPERREADYAQWRLDDPALNLALSTGREAAGLDHLGLDEPSDASLREVASRLEAAGHPLLEQEDAHCCYARGEKAWARDPQGVVWETFHTRERSAERGEDAPSAPPRAPGPPAGACC